MPLYFFDLHDGEDHTVDDFGMEFEHFEDARNHAVSFLPDIAREELPDGPRRDFICHVRTGGGQVVYRAVLKFREDRFGDDAEREGSAAPDARSTDDVTAVGSGKPVIGTPGQGVRHDEG